MSEPLLIIIFGLSGSGKKILLKAFNPSENDYSVHIKDTNRKKKGYDDYEIRYVDDFNPKNYGYVYQTYAIRYGISKAQIKEAINNNQKHLIICNDISTIQLIKNDYGDLVRIIFCYFDAPQDEINKIQKEMNILDDEIELRLEKTSILYKQFIDNHKLFNGYFSISFDEDVDTIKSKLEFSIQNDNFTDFSKMVKEVIHLLNSPNKNNKNTIVKDYAFIIMPIRNDRENKDIYSNIIRACSEFSIKAEGVNSIQFTGRITEKIQGCIKLSEFLIADISYSRPSVYYEVGFADAFEKPIIFIAKRGTKPHFDIRENKILFYNNSKHLYELLKESIYEIRL